MKLLLALVTSLTFAAAQAEPFAGGNAGAGKKLFEQSHCDRCHISMMGGDGSAIFTRPDRKIGSPRQLVDRLRVCSGGAGITMTGQDEQDLGAYLNRNYYHFK